MPAKRVKRPKLDRDRPDRKWPTLFGASAQANAAPPAAEAQRPASKDGERAVLSDTVDLGYRVIDDYLKQSRQAAQAFSPASWMRGPASPGSPDEMQQMAQRVMQYGWDFAGLWFEMWSRMGGPGGWPQPPGGGAAGGPVGPGGPVAPVAGGDPKEGVAASAESQDQEALVVSVESPQPTTTAVQLRPGRYGELTIPALRPEDHDGPPIKGVTIERSAEDGSWLVRVVVAAGQRPGSYRAPIVEAATNLPRGTLSVRVKAQKR